MARAPNEKLNKALSLYQKGYKLVDIAKELDIPPGTVRRWKKTYNWDNSERSEKENDKSERSVSKKSKENEKKKRKEKAIAEEVKEVLENNELTDKQRLFCIYYNKCFNATKAYQKAYQVDYDTANAHGYKLLSNVVIKDELQKLKQAKLNRVMLSEDDIFQKYIDIAFADITDFLEFGNEEVDGEFEQYTRSYVNIKHSFEVDGTLISEVS